MQDQDQDQEEVLVSEGLEVAEVAQGLVSAAWVSVVAA